MQIRNNYDKEVFNGEIGIMSGIDTQESALLVDYPGIGTVSYEESELGELVLAYATSVHNSQVPERHSHLADLLREKHGNQVPVQKGKCGDILGVDRIWQYAWLI